MSTSIRWVCGATLAMCAAFGIGRFAYTPLLPEMMNSYGWSFAQAGDVASANFLGYMAGAMFAPSMANSPKARTWMLLSLVASVLTTYLGAEVTGFWGWLVLRFAAGVASALCMVILTTHLMQTLTRQGTSQLGNIHIAGVGAGILMCMGVVYLSVDVAGQWARLGVLAGVLMALSWLLLNRQPWHLTKIDDADVVRGEKAKLWPLTIGYGFFGFGYVVAATFVVAMGESIVSGQSGAQIDAQVDAQVDAKMVWIFVGASLIPSVYIWQWLANKFGLLRILRIAYVVESVGVLLAGWAQSIDVLVLACILLGGTFGAITALGLSAARFVAPQRVAYAVSAMTVSFAVGQLLGPAIAGRMADELGGFLWPSVVAASLLLLAAILARHTSR